MANKVILSEQFKLKALDFINGIFYGVVIPVGYYVQELIPAWNVHPVWKIAAAAFLSYILKKFVEKPKVTTTYSSNEKAIAVSNDIKEQQ